MIPGLSWGIPFIGVLLSVALLPTLAARFWHRHMALVMALWSAALVVPWAAAFGVPAAAHLVWHAFLTEYLPFTALLLALFVTGGGILLKGGPWGRPGGNTLLLALGTVLAGVMGTTGAAMVLIHPLLRANAHRSRKAHLVLFFILLVANAGGATTPLGDPPLYLGFLQGVPFLWPLRFLLAPLAVLALPLLAAFWLVDRHLAKGEPPPGKVARLRVRGGLNILLLALVVAAVGLQGVWRPGEVVLWGVPIGAERLAAVGVMLLVTVISLRSTAPAIRRGNLFSWAPMAEVAVLFAGIFITIAPVLALLAAGLSGPAAPLLRLLADAEGAPVALRYFWATGLLSAFLDNAPTYLVFFQLGGNDPALLTAARADVLVAISAGAVFFGALTYIGNAPNLMVRGIAARRGIRMPGFFGYMGWAGLLLLPGFALVSLVFFIAG